jgi:hypothetical protein
MVSGISTYAEAARLYALPLALSGRNGEAHSESRQPVASECELVHIWDGICVLNINSPVMTLPQSKGHRTGG